MFIVDYILKRVVFLNNENSRCYLNLKLQLVFVIVRRILLSMQSKITKVIKTQHNIVIGKNVGINPIIIFIPVILREFYLGF